MKNLVKVLKNLEGKTLVLTHHNADVDSVCAGLVLANMINADIATPDTISSVAQQVIGDEKKRILVKPDTKNYNTMIIVDAASVEQILPMNPDAKHNMMIDHHSEGSLKNSVDYAFTDKTYKATCAIIFELSKEMRYSLSKREAIYLMAGIIADTAHLKLADRRIFQQLVELMDQVQLDEVLPKLQQEMDYSERVAILKALSRTDLYKCGDYIVAISHISSHEAPAARALAQYADIGIVIAKRKEEIRISARGKRVLQEKIHLAHDVMSKLDKVISGSGGGHDMAASANGSNVESSKEAEKVILNEISKKLGTVSKL